MNNIRIYNILLLFFRFVSRNISQELNKTLAFRRNHFSLRAFAMILQFWPQRDTSFTGSASTEKRGHFATTGYVVRWWPFATLGSIR
jgi:hypothetical protein